MASVNDAPLLAAQSPASLQPPGPVNPAYLIYSTALASDLCTGEALAEHSICVCAHTHTHVERQL